METLGEFELGPEGDLVGIYTGDAKALMPYVPDESVDLILTDPVYDSLAQYQWLARAAWRVLKPDGALLAFCSAKTEWEVIQVMSTPLRFVYPLNYIVQAKPHALRDHNIFVWRTPCLWFDKGGSKPHTRTIDTIITSGPPQGRHRWNKNLAAFERWLTDFTVPGAIILDPFTGSGTCPVACKRHQRRWLAFEIDPTEAQAARTRVCQTDPLFNGIQLEFAT